MVIEESTFESTLSTNLGTNTTTSLRTSRVDEGWAAKGLFGVCRVGGSCFSSVSVMGKKSQRRGQGGIKRGEKRRKNIKMCVD